MEVILRSAVSNLGEALGVPRTYVRLMLGEESPNQESPGDESPDEGPPDIALSGQKPLDEEPLGESWAEDVEVPSEELVEAADDSLELPPNTPDASVIDKNGRNPTQGEEHDEP